MAQVKTYTAPDRAQFSSTVLTKSLAFLSLAAIVVVHFLDLGDKLAETPYLGYAYLALIAGCLVAAFMIARTGDRRGWLLGGALALGAIIAYALTRTTGLPGAMDDIGNWLEPLGVVALISEGVMVLLSAYVLGRDV